MQSILDTNVLLRFLIRDNVAQYKQALRWFKEAEAGERTIVVSPIVVAEISFVLETFYKKSRGEVADALEAFVSQRWLEIMERDVLLGLWPWYRSGLHFVDSFLLSWAAVHIGDILTFDRQVHAKKSI